MKVLAIFIHMRVQNEIDRFNLVKDAIMHLPQLGNRGSYLIQKMNDKLVEHKQYIAEYGQDLEEVRVCGCFYFTGKFWVYRRTIEVLS